jgi:signal transduction histidine kinase
MSQPRIQDMKWAEVEDMLRKTRNQATAGQYAASVVHDINNPLEAATNLAYLVKETADDPDSVRKYIVLLQEQLTILAGITQRTLDYYRTPAEMKSVNLADVLSAAVRIFEHKITSKELNFQKVLPEGTLVSGHAGDLLQVVTNLLANALDALPEKGTLSIHLSKHKHEAHILIVDNGHGIPEAILTKIFDPFFTTKQDRGTGLGLAISKSIVERHRGRIRTRSCVRPGRSGTAFRISLPLEPATNTSQPSALGQS